MTYKKICTYIIEFTLCGICGWIYETALTSYLWGEFAERGFLHIPVLPIYGVFSFILIPIFRKHNGFLTVFIGSTIITTALELICAYAIEMILHQRLWSYRDWDFNFFDGRISLYSSLMFGVLSLILIKIVHPLVNKFSEKSSARTISITGSICGLAIIADFIITSYQNIKK